MGPEVILKNAGRPVEPLLDGLRYLAAGNGIFLERKSSLFSTCVRVESCPLLETAEESCRLHLPPLPPVHVRAMLAFFLHAFWRHGGEAVLLLLYHPEARRFLWHCPEQTVELRETWSGRWEASSHIRYRDLLEPPPGFVVLGDAHSHADLPAYASYTDREDERYKDGLHIVVGSLHRLPADLHVEFVMDQRRFEISPQDLFAETRPRPFSEVPRAWKEQIRIRRSPYRQSTSTSGGTR